MISMRQFREPRPECWPAYMTLSARKKLGRRIREALVDLERWRGENGWSGKDQYHPDQVLLHPMTLGAWGRAYAELAAADPHPLWREGLRACCETMRSLSNRGNRFRHACWGLPFDYHGNPPDFPYLITTTLCGMALMGAHTVLREPDYLRQAESAGRWIVEENGFSTDESGRICFYYAPCDALRLPIHNVNAMAAGFLAQLGVRLGNAALREAADQAMAYLATKQGTDGSWRYQENNLKKGPDSHTGYILEGILLYLHANPDRIPALRATLEQGLTYYRENQFDGPMALHGDANSSRREGRLWAQGWGIAAMVLAHRVTGDFKWLDQAIATAEWSLANLRRPDGAFRMFSDDDRAFPRNIAHMAYGLAFLYRECLS